MPLSLSNGTTSIDVKVTAPDGITVITYNIVATWSNAFPSGLVSYWGMNNNAADNVVATGNNGTWDGTAAYEAGKLGSAASLSGTKSINCGDSPTSLPAGNSDRTFAAWIYPTTSDYVTIVGWGIDDGQKLSEIVKTSEGYIQFHGNGADVQSSGTVSLNTWTHVVVTLNAGAVRFYINGSQDSNTSDTVALNTPLQNCRIGRQPALNEQHFQGKLDEIGIWSRALSQEEVTTLYNNGAGIPY